MTWITSNLLAFFALGIAAALAGSISSKWRWCLCGVAAVSFLIGGWATLHLLTSTPGGEKTVHQPLRPAPTQPPPPVAGPLEPLRQRWNSEDPADWPVAELLASICDTSYLSPIDAKEPLRRLGFTGVEAIVESSMIGYVASADDTTVIVLRGTDNKVDWVVNLDMRSTEVEQGSIHRGFLSTYEAMKPQILKALDQSKPKHLWVTGHSLGGALAVACAYDLVEKQRRHLDGLITFGQPMVMKRDLASYCDNMLVSRYAHYVNDEDIVPRIPPGYAHFGSLVWFTKTGVQRSEPKLVFGAAASAEAAGLKPLSEREFANVKRKLQADQRASKDPPVYQGMESWIDHHDMSRYLDRIRENTRRQSSGKGSGPAAQ